MPSRAALGPLAGELAASGLAEWMVEPGTRRDLVNTGSRPRRYRCVALRGLAGSDECG